MKTYCVSCKKYTANDYWNVRKTKQNRLLFLSNCAVCGKKVGKDLLLYFTYFSDSKDLAKRAT